MKASMLLFAALGCSGCCCNGMEFTDKEPWKLAVLNETANPQTTALDAGTANVFEIEGPQKSFHMRFVVLNPDAAGQGEFVGADCAACVSEAVGHHAVLLRTSGLAPIDLTKISREQLVEGVALDGSARVASPADAAPTRLDATGAKLRFIESCKANVLLVEKKVETSPRNFEEKSWYELRDTPCAGTAKTLSR